MKAAVRFQKLRWRLKRLQAMPPGEVVWRAGIALQDALAAPRCANRPMDVTARVLDSRLAGLTFDGRRVGLSLDLDGGRVGTAVPPDYQQGWPVVYAPRLAFRGESAAGDARLAWEAHRHLVFPLLALNYRMTGDPRHLDTLALLLANWTRENPYRHGIAWVSVMEVAIRAYSWMAAMAFLPDDPRAGACRERLRAGVLNMIPYVASRRARYSSANNHLVVEMMAVGVAGFAFQHEPWVRKALGGMDEAFLEQQSGDGVNLEHAMHYHLFVMEAVSLLMAAMQAAKREIPPMWLGTLARMAAYARDAGAGTGALCAFGDSDDGRLLDLTGDRSDYAAYVLALAEGQTGQSFLPKGAGIPETARRLLPENVRPGKVRREAPASATYARGGYSFLRSQDGRALVGMDHAALGYGRLAAHGHADALSIQLFLQGRPVLTDPGTYLYYADAAQRDAFRSTAWHNTVAIDGRDQSEMLGAFLWGRRARATLVRAVHTQKEDLVEAFHNGYAPVIHTRTLAFDRRATLRVTDRLSGGACRWQMGYLLAPDVRIVSREGNRFTLASGANAVRLVFPEMGEAFAESAWYAPHYGVRADTIRLRLQGASAGELALTTIITWGGEGSCLEKS